MRATCDAQIAWVLAHPHMSDWLKQALRGANGRDPIALQNDMEILRHLVVPRAQYQIDIATSAMLPAVLGT